LREPDDQSERTKLALRFAAIAPQACVEKGLEDGVNSAKRMQPSASRVVAGSPDQKCKSNDQNQDNQHPVLSFDSKNVKWLNEKLHRRRPFVVQNRRFSAEKILFIYSVCGATQWRGVPPEQAPPSSIKRTLVQDAGQAVSLSKSASVYLTSSGPIIDAPAGGGERPCPGDGGNGLKTDGDCNGGVLRRVHDEGHGQLSHGIRCTRSSNFRSNGARWLREKVYSKMPHPIRHKMRQ
jgi:hypothetical protein